MKPGGTYGKVQENKIHEILGGFSGGLFFRGISFGDK
jgi:hypothetical protein